ncbi:hypothetical protein D3C71_1995740 [compost metagenome]
MKRIGILAIVGSLSIVVGNAIGVIAVTYDNPSATGHSVLIDINGGTVIVLLMAGLLLVLGHVIVIASGIEAENQSFV